MGFWKEKLIEWQDRGYMDTDVYICQQCIDDIFVRQLIAEHGEQGKCSFCKNKNGKIVRRKVIPLITLMPYIIKYLDTYFLDAVDWGGYDYETKEYMFTTYDLYDIAEIIASEIGIDNMDLINELSNILGDKFLVYSKDIWSTKVDELFDQWEKFCQYVQELQEYSVEQIVNLCDRDDAPDMLRMVSDCLYMVLENCRKMNLVEYLSSEQNIYRGVRHNNYPMGFNYYPASFIGTAPAIRVKSNRMSEERDMMFYGSMDKDVIIKELESNEVSDKPIVIGTFHTNKRVKILNLAVLSDCKRPSILDVEHKDILDSWYFVKKFINDISQPINDGLQMKLNIEIQKKDKDYIRINELKKEIDKEYKPTQVFTKYIQRKTQYKGISFRSSKLLERPLNKEDGYDKNYVLFVPNCDCIDECDDKDLSKLQLIMEHEVDIYKDFDFI